MNHVETHVTRTRQPEQGVEIGSIIIKQAALVMNHPRNLRDIFLKKPDRVGIRQHQGGDLTVKRRLQRAQVHATIRTGLDRDHIIPRQPRAAGIGAVGGIRNEHFGAVLPLFAEIFPNHHDPGVFPVGARGGLQSHRIHAGNSTQHGLEFIEQHQGSLTSGLRLIGMEMGKSGQ